MAVTCKLWLAPLRGVTIRAFRETFAEAIREAGFAGAFAPFTVHYAETFIVPASVGRYTIRPSGEGAEKTHATIKAYVRT